MTEENHSGSSDPNVAVVIPTYHRNSKLQRAVNSVLRQTYEDWKLYVVNDAPENSIQDVIPDDNRIECIRHDENKGAPAARNTGIQASEASYIAFLDDDDAWKSEKLERQVNAFRGLSQDYGLIYTGGDIVKNDTVVKTNQPNTTGEVFDELLGGNFIPSETPVVRRECIEQVGPFDTALESSQDYDLWLRIARSYKLYAIPDSLAIAYQGHKDRISKNARRKYNGKMRFINKHREDLEKIPAAMSTHLKQLGVYTMLINKPTESRRYLIDSVKYDKTQFTVSYYILATFLPDFVQSLMLDHRRTIGNLLPGV
jgi:glycosyltransferase involved in cell wall biosynthesis